MSILKKYFTLYDIYSIIILAFFFNFSIAFSSSQSNLWIFSIIDFAIIFMILYLARKSQENPDGHLWTILRRAYIIPLFFFIFEQNQYYVRIINPNLYDDVLIAWDFFIFGCNPTEWLSQFRNPFLTEILQLSYILYFFMPLTQGIEWHLREKNNEYDRFAGLIVLSFYLSYLLYYLMPAIGPCFTLHDYTKVYEEFQGLLFSDYFRAMVDFGRGIPFGAPNPAAYTSVDCMPSAHTSITLLNMYFAFKYKSRLKWMYLVFGVLLIMSTMYLRYHYLVDIIAGVMLAVLSFYLDKLLKKKYK